MNTHFTKIHAPPLEQKLRLVEDLWDSIAEEIEKMPVPAWQLEELRRRKKSFDANPNAGKSWAEVEKELRVRCKAATVSPSTTL